MPFLSLSFMVGKFAGWLIYLPALLNWVSMFQNSMGGSKIMSFMLQEHIFPVAWFSICKKCPSCSMWTTLYPGFHFKSHLLGCLFLKYTLSQILKDGGVLSMIFWAILNLFSSRVFFAMAKANLCISRFSIPESGLLENVVWVLTGDVIEGLDPFHILRRMVFLQLPSSVLLCNLQPLGSNTCPS